jgi:hypothetical protein
MDERLVLMKRGQILGFCALLPTLVTIVLLAAIGQPWVAGIVASSLTVVVGLFLTGRNLPKLSQYQPMHPPEVPDTTAPSNGSEAAPPAM